MWLKLPRGDFLSHSEFLIRRALTLSSIPGHMNLLADPENCQGGPACQYHYN
jgi:hypothetical protein